MNESNTIDEEHWAMVARRLRDAIESKRVPSHLLESFTAATVAFEKSTSALNVPNETALFMVKVLRDIWGPRDYELKPVADQLEQAIRVEMEKT